MVGADNAPLRVVPELDYKRYAGTWYEIARLPNRFEKKCVSNVTELHRPARWAYNGDQPLQAVRWQHQ